MMIFLAGVLSGLFFYHPDLFRGADMDIILSLLFCLEAAFGYWLLYRSGVLNRTFLIFLSAAMLALAFSLRALCLNYETLDYQNFLSVWVDFFRRNGGFAALSQPVGNYNIPYLYFLALFSYLPLDDLYLIKLLSIFFDLLLAWAAMGIVKKLGGSPGQRLAAFFLVLFLPTVVLNGALWGQCDSIYVALALMSIYWALDDRPVLSMLAMTLSFGFKLQAVFIMPVLAILWMQGKFKLRHFLIFPLAYVILVLPAVLLGRPFLETITLYFNQTGSIGSGLNYNSPSIFGIFWHVDNEALASKLAIAAAFVFMLLVLLVCYVNRKRLSSRSMLTAAVLLAVGIPFLLPHMHDRYFFASDILTLTLACVCLRFSPAAVLAQFASLLGYHAYLKMRYLLPMSYGSWALILVLIMAAALLFRELKDGLPGDGGKKFKMLLDKS